MLQLIRAPIVAIWTDWFSWYFWQRFLVCPGTPRCLSISVYRRLVSMYPSAPRHTAIAAVLPARLQMHWSSQTVHTTVLHAAGLLLPLAYLARVTGQRGVETYTWAALRVSNCSTVTVK